MQARRVISVLVAGVGFANLAKMPTATAAEHELQVNTSGCAELDAAELVRLTRLELANAADNIEVSYRCDEGGIAIELRETGRDIRVSRQMPRDCCKESAERTLALLAAGLYAVATPMLLVPVANDPRKPPEKPDSDDKPTTTPADPKSSQENEASGTLPQLRAQQPLRQPLGRPVGQPLDPTLAPPAASWPLSSANQAAHEPDDSVPLPNSSAHDISLTAQFRLYNVGSGSNTYGARLSYLYWLTEEFGFGPIADGDFGTVERMGGRVHVRAFHLGGTVAWRFAHGRWVDAAISPFAALSMVQLIGEAGAPADDNSAPTVRADTVTGATGSAGLRLSTWFGAQPLRLRAGAETGVLFRAPRGEVLNDAPVQLDGLWLGFALGVDLGWDTIKPKPEVAEKGTP